ncbi:hypothetical protein [Kumtagia ephedrae]|jgi:hypothetical protein|uniref:Uncharacterized protein n=1 Tax=Kumtagia ephedrae TaxID=2116701 RepID=A0A2P7SPJ3_9HYPH|nr:hypothetical protein [Mesorhizobium ephedrae]PSJ64406.1 hypothetical protein C7I84_05505 [Mesorhizobium ephedrae]
MWIKLTSVRDETVLLAVDKVTHVTARESGGSSVYLLGDTVDGRPRVLGVKETLDQLAALLDVSGAPAKRAAKAAK